MRRRPLRWLALPLLGAGLLTSAGHATVRPPLSDGLRPGFQGEDSPAPGDLDARRGSLAPTGAQRAAVRDLHAHAWWTPFGTPRSLFDRHEHYLAPARPGDPVDVARAWVRDHAALFRLTPERTAPEVLELVANNALYDATDNRRRLHHLAPRAKDSTLPHVVLFRQLFDGVPAADDGLLTVLLDRANRVVYVSSSVTGDPRVTNTATLGAAAAWRAAATDVGWIAAPDAVTEIGRASVADFTGVRVAGQPEAQLVRLRALPTPRDGVRLVYEVNVMDNTRVGRAEPLGYVSFVDAETGEVLVRHNAIDYFADLRLPMQAPLPDPRWHVFPNTPEWPVTGEQAQDTRPEWCWVENTCDLRAGGPGGADDPREKYPQVHDPYDIDPETGQPSLTSRGNDAYTTASYVSHLTPDAVVRPAEPDPTRTYDYAFTDQWHTSNCNLEGNYATPELNDVDAAIMNLFFNYGRMHDWSYYLGFTESTWNMQEVNYGEDAEGSATAKGQDPELGQAQAGSVAGSIVFTGRDNANQRTMADGIAPITNQYLWHPLQASFYPPCVDGAFDMSVVGHEYTHAISNRMIGGPEDGIGGNEGGSMGESWSDLAAMEYLNGYGFAPVGDENRYAVGPYVTGSKQRGIRNYGMNDSPLNYSDLAYDGSGSTSPHSDGEIWSAANFTARQALVDKYDAEFPYDDKALQYECADGRKDADECPGNRRWVQLMFDAFLIQDANVGMPAAAEAQIAADVARFGGANQKELWHAYASRGLGDESDEAGFPDWTTPEEDTEASIRFRAVPVDGGGVPVEMYVYVGQYSARTAELTIGKRGTPSPVQSLLPGTYEFVARADGYGMYRFTETFTAREERTVDVPLRKNLASTYNDADATGDGGNFEGLIDDTEETNWAFLGDDETADVEGKQVTVDLAGGRQLVREIQVSAIARPAESGNEYDPAGQNRFSMLRSFEILSCDETAGDDCDDADSYEVEYTSAPDAFPSGRPRPLSPDLKLKTFDVPDFYATHVRLRVLTNQCTGNPLFSVQENPVGDPASDPDCVNGFTAATLTNTDIEPTDPPPLANNTQKHIVRAAELQVFSSVTPGQPNTFPRDKGEDDGDVGGDKAGPDTTPATGASPALPVAATVLAAAAALSLRRRRSA